MKRYPRILILTPFRNVSHSFSQYFKSLLALDYPLSKIDIYWLENDSSDNTFNLLEKGVEKLDRLYRGFTSFNSVTLESVKIIGKVKRNDQKSLEYDRACIFNVFIGVMPKHED